MEIELANAVTKALSIQECPVKEKHVRTIIIGTFKQRSSQTFWQLVSSKVLSRRRRKCSRYMEKMEYMEDMERRGRNN